MRAPATCARCQERLRLGPHAPPTPPPDTPTPVPTPYVVVVAPQVNLRSGPSVAYPVIGQAVKDQTFAITGRNDAFTWWQVCCIDGQQGWITTQLTAPGGPADTVPIVAPPELPQLPPTPFPTSTLPPLTATPLAPLVTPTAEPDDGSGNLGDPGDEEPPPPTAAPTEPPEEPTPTVPPLS